MKKEKGILAEYDGLDIDEIIITIEKSFDIKIDDKDSNGIKTYGDFETLILSKINGDEKNDCTSQQAFYKLRNIISETFNINKEDIKLETKLDQIFPKKNRIKNIQLLEKELSIKNKFLTHSAIQFIVLFMVFSSSVIFLYFNSLYAIILFSIGMILSEELKTKKFAFNDIREVSEFLKNENYKNSRKNTNSFNPIEIKDIVKNIFSDKLDIEKSKLNSDTLL